MESTDKKNTCFGVVWKQFEPTNQWKPFRPMLVESAIFRNKTFYRFLTKEFCDAIDSNEWKINKTNLEIVENVNYFEVKIYWTNRMIRIDRPF